MHSKHKPVGCFDLKLQREQEGKYFSKPKSCQKDIELDQSGQTKKTKYKYQCWKGRRETSHSWCFCVENPNHPQEKHSNKSESIEFTGCTVYKHPLSMDLP